MKKIFEILFLLLCCMFMYSCGADNVEKIPIQDFFGKPERTNFKLSPDGSRIAYLGIDEHCRNIFILNINNPDSSKQLTYQGHMNVQYFFWADDNKIVYSNSQSITDSLRLYTIDVNTDESKLLLPVSKHTLRWLQPNKSINGNLLAQINLRDSTVFDLYRIPINGAGPVLIEKNDGKINSWFASADGKVRLALSSDSVEDKFWYRAEEGLPYENILQTDFASSFVPLGNVKGSLTNIYALSNIGRDKQAIVEYDLLSKTERVIAENPHSDLNRDGYLSSRNELIFSTVFNNKKQTEIYNSELKSIYKKIENKFDGLTIDIIDVDSAFNTVLFKTYTDVNPGGVYYYSKKKDNIVELTAINPALKEARLSHMEEVSFYSRDGREIKGYLTYPKKQSVNYPVVVLVHDGPNRRDVWGFNPEVQFLANRGYAVFQVNYRGSTGFGKNFYTAGFKQWGGEIQNDINDGLSWLIHKGIADKNNIAIMGTGFGGYSALYAACFNPTLYKCAISSSGYTNLFSYFKEIPTYHQPYKQLYYKIIGDPVKEYELFKAISPLFHADRIRMPILLFHGGKDGYNSITDVYQFVQKVRNNNVDIQYILKEEEGRRFRKEENIIEYYQQIEQFLNIQLRNGKN